MGMDKSRTDREQNKFKEVGGETTHSVNTLKAYMISDLAESGDPKYYGYLDADGKWYIMELTSTAVRYIRGDSGYTTNWTNRASLSYDYYDTIF